MFFTRKPDLIEAWQFTGSLDDAPVWVSGILARADKDPDQADKGRDARAVLRDGRSEIMLYVGHWLVRHPDGTLEPMTDEQVQARFERVE